MKTNYRDWLCTIPLDLSLLAYNRAIFLLLLITLVNIDYEILSALLSQGLARSIPIKSMKIMTPPCISTKDNNKIFSPKIKEHFHFQ